MSEQSNIFDRDDQTFFVVVNHEEQYSIWPSSKEIPPGWRTVGEPRDRQACLQYIEEVWTDLRPASLRKKMDGLT